MSSRFKMWANPWVRRPMLVVLALVLLLGGCWMVIDQLGQEAWRSFANEFAAGGETVDFLKLQSTPVTDAENFCAIPRLQDLAVREQDSAIGEANRKRIKKLELEHDMTMALSRPGISSSIPNDFEKVVKAMRKERKWPIPAEPGDPARDADAGFGKWDFLVADLAAGLARPYAHWISSTAGQNLKRPYEETHSWQLLPAMTLARSLSLRAATAAAAGDLPKAHESLRIAKRLAMASFDDLLLMNGRAALAMEMSTLQAMWEVCYRRQGTAEDWLQLEQIATTYDYRKAVLRNYRGALAASIDTVRFCAETRHPQYLQTLFASGSEEEGPSRAWMVALQLAPSGFFDSLATGIGSNGLRHAIRPLRDEGWAGLLRGRHAFAVQSREPRPSWNFLSRAADDSFQPFAESMIPHVWVAVALDQAAIACVLERAFLSGGSYPASIEGLTLADGRPLPPDACTGRPMHYRQTADGRYALWSQAVDGLDDDAGRGADRADYIGPDYKGDWVWSYSVSP